MRTMPCRKRYVPHILRPKRSMPPVMMRSSWKICAVLAFAKLLLRIRLLRSLLKTPSLPNRERSSFMRTRPRSIT
nr:hypothetical protein THEDDIDL_THEDDIDL_CDS_0009 [Microvirus sp.]